MKRINNEEVFREAEQSGVPTIKGDRKIVWFEEFGDRSTLEKKWLYRTQMRSTDATLNTDEKHIEVKDSLLGLHSYRVDEKDRVGELEGIEWTLPQALTTYDKMVFRRGYLEMRAKVPFRHGAWPSFWMLTYEPLMESRLRSEIDIFEIFSSPDTVVCNLHKSLRDKDGKLIARCQLDGSMVSKKRFTFENPENINDEYHIYGMEWTDKDISFLIDGVPYTTISLTESYTNNPDLQDMDNHQDYHFVILNNFVFTPGHHWCPEKYRILPEDPSPVDYYIDWIRLYQKDGEDILVEE